MVWTNAEAEAVKIDPDTMAIVWRYTPSPHWDEWSEAIMLHDLVPRKYTTQSAAASDAQVSSERL